MSSNVGLPTPRGTGTSGYVQRNLSHFRPRSPPRSSTSDLLQPHRHRQPDAAILDHDRRRKIEVEVFTLRDKLEEEGLEEDEIDDRCEALRRKLAAQDEGGKGDGGGRGLKSHQVHELAAAKIREDERVRRALGIRGDYEEGQHWKRKEERKSAAGGGVEAPARERRAVERRRSRSPERTGGRAPPRRSPEGRGRRRRSRSASSSRSRSRSSSGYSD